MKKLIPYLFAIWFSVGWLSAQTTVTISNTVQAANIPRPGINLGGGQTALSYFGPNQLFKNLNYAQGGDMPGFYWATTEECSPGPNSIYNWFNNIFDTFGYPDNFWTGADFVAIAKDTGTSFGSGTISGSTNNQGTVGTVFSLGAGISRTCNPSAEPPPVYIPYGDVMVTRLLHPGAVALALMTPNAFYGGFPSSSTWNTTDTDPTSTNTIHSLQLLTGTAASFADDAVLQNATNPDSTLAATYVPWINLNGSYTASFHAKCAVPGCTINVSVTRNGGTVYVPGSTVVSPAYSATPGAGWTTYSYPFTASETGAQGSGIYYVLTCTGTCLLSDADLTEGSTLAGNTTVFRDAVVSELQKMKPGSIRYMDSTQWCSDVADQIAPTGNRRWCGASEYVNWIQGPPIGYNDLLQLCNVIGADCWLSVGITNQPADWTTLVNWLSTSGWVSTFASSGHKIYLEHGNEPWNSGAVATMNQGNGVAYGYTLGVNLAAAKAATGYNSSVIKLVGASWTAPIQGYSNSGWLANIMQYAGCTSGTQPGCPDFVDNAPYTLTWINNWDSTGPNVSNTGAPFLDEWAEISNIDSVASIPTTPPTFPWQYASGSVKINTAYGIANYNVPMSIYETNISTTNGNTISQLNLNQIADSVGEGLAQAQHMLLQQRDAGVTGPINAFALAQNYFNFNDTHPPAIGMWGTVIALATGPGQAVNSANYERPYQMAMDVINNAIGSNTNLMSVTQSGTPTFSYAGGQQLNGYAGVYDTILPNSAVPYVNCFAYANTAKTNWTTICFNNNLTSSESVTLTGAGAPSGSVSKTLFPNSGNVITDNNEATYVGPSSLPLVVTYPASTSTSGTTYSIPAASMIALTYGSGSPTLVSIAVTPNPANTTIGGTIQLTATGTYSDSSTVDLTSTATWSNGGSASFTVSAGLVTGVASGSGGATATVSGITGSATVNVIVETPLTITIQHASANMHGAALQTGSSLTITAVCTYAVHATDNCTSAGGITWINSRAASGKFTVTGTTTATVTAVEDPGTLLTDSADVAAQVNGFIDQTNGRVTFFVQHPGDTWYQYPTPFYLGYTNFQGTQLPLNVAIGSTVTLGSGIVINQADGGHTGNPVSTSCTWGASNGHATVDVYGNVTGVSAGAVDLTCNRLGDASYGASTQSGWVSPGNVITLTVIAGGTSNQQWYVRPDGGLPYVNGTQTPFGQCDAKTNAAYSGPTAARWQAGKVYALNALIAAPNGHTFKVTTAGTSNSPLQPTWPSSGTVSDGTVVWTDQGTYPVGQACGAANLVYLWADVNTYQVTNWMIQGGDTVNIAPGQYPQGDGGTPGTDGGLANCAGNPGNCQMPSIPSGTSARHTTIQATGAGVQLYGVFGAGSIFNVTDSQFFDISKANGGFEVTSHGACSTNGNFTAHCPPNGNYGVNGIATSALTASANLNGQNIHGMAGSAWLGATGVGVAADSNFIQAAIGGINMDDNPWATGNISQAGGLSLTNTKTQFVGCVEGYPVTLTYDYPECRGQTLGNYGDGFGTASTTGNWYFDHDIWNYNEQDGLDLLHSGMLSLVVTNSSATGNVGQPFKIGSGRTVTFFNDLAFANCGRTGYPVGDQPAINPGGETLCRADDTIPIAFDYFGKINISFLTTISTQATIFDITNTGDDASHITSSLQNTVTMGYGDDNVNGGVPPGFFFTAGTVPANMGWTTRQYNYFYNLKPGASNPCSFTLLTGEACASPFFVNQYQVATPIPTPISNETVLDGMTGEITGSSPMIAAGVCISGITTDINGVTRPCPPTIGAFEPASAPPTAATPVPSPGAGSYTGSQSVTLTSSTAGTNICYTTTGATPAATTAGTCDIGSTQISNGGTATVATSLTLKYLATESGFINSSVGSAAYTITAPTAATPTPSPGAGTYNTAQTVTVTSATSGAIICATLNGSTPAATTPGTCDAGSTTISNGGTISVSVTSTLKMLATKATFTNSGVGSYGYTIIAVTPVASPVAGTYSSTQTVSLTTSTGGAAIYYTTDGSTPTTSSTVYTTAITIATSTLLKAIAVASGFTNSSVGSFPYTISASPSPPSQLHGTINFFSTATIH